MFQQILPTQTIRNMLQKFNDVNIQVDVGILSQSTSCMTSISEHELNIQIPLCNVWYSST